MNKKSSMQELTWSDIRDRVALVNPKLTSLLDKLSPDSSYTFFLAEYSYGSKILADGKIHFPTHENGLLPIDHPLMDSDIQEKLGYVMGTNPMALLLNNTIELFMNVESRVIPYRLISEGEIFGTWGFLEYMKHDNSTFFFAPIPLWDMTAGARSIFLLPKISEVAAFNKVRKKFEIQLEAPKQLSEHWPILRDIANHHSFNQPWSVELLYFSKRWVETINDPEWQEFKSYLYDLAWRGSEFWRSQFCWELTFSRILANRNIKPCPYVADMVSHLLATSVGAVSGLRPLLDNKAAPIENLITVFEEEYNINYAPLIIGPANFSVFELNPEPIYYSFHYPTAIKMSPKSSSRSSLISDMYQIRLLLYKYLEDIKNSNLKIAGTTLYEMAKVVDFTFCHYLSDNETKMTSSNIILEQDRSFQAALDICNIKEPPKNAPFLNGCVKIAKKLESSSQQPLVQLHEKSTVKEEA
ncbi:MAG: hypothetical protein HKM04_02295 [Legionellales bacterium]|nr:hypothetical protein [Legionellales bacterium]